MHSVKAMEFSQKFSKFKTFTRHLLPHINSTVQIPYPITKLQCAQNNEKYHPKVATTLWPFLLLLLSSYRLIYNNSVQQLICHWWCLFDIHNITYFIIINIKQSRARSFCAFCKLYNIHIVYWDRATHNVMCGLAKFKWI